MEEAPTTTRRAAGTALSARMLEAQRAFQSVVKQELQLLLERGTKREEAVKLLLRRIVASTEPPEAAAVRGVMRQFQMNYDDAVRALIVKQELGRLKRQGLDSFAAIEELTRKMRSREGEEVEAGRDEEVEQEVEQQAEHILVEEKEKEDVSTQEENEVPPEKEDKDSEPMPAAEMASPTSEKDGNESSLSLIQRIGQVSISSGHTPERESEEREGEQETNEDTDGEENESVGEKNKALFKSPLRVKSPNSSNLADLTPQSRKRRAAFGTQYDAANASRSNSNGRSVKPLFPSLKKQKLCAEVGDGFLQVVTRKSKPTSASLAKSTAAAAGTPGPSPNGGKSGGSARGDHSSKNLHKRQRESPTGLQDEDESPIAEELRVSHVHHRHHAHHHSKRQKSSSTH
ncbi:hypothetical protein PHYPSEUDO_003346 [Phytophthora pseudosyringae]|uniref:Uncharacterized protein n=1 Tax=Phytophthora pseudosyringae TaxID=221518 RepID=A0A8T1VRF5_9STRA|nr:hypothetical protein PHYPSEUDO_003346 [Phytophthora pseudosyringae]